MGCSPPRAGRIAGLLGLVVLSVSPRAAAEERSFHRLVTANGHTAVSFDRARSRFDTFLEHPYRYFAPRTDPADHCAEADESRDLAFDFYFGVRDGAAGTWLSDVPVDAGGYVPGTGILWAEQHLGTGRELRA